MPTPNNFMYNTLSRMKVLYAKTVYRCFVKYVFQYYHKLDFAVENVCPRSFSFLNLFWRPQTPT